MLRRKDDMKEWQKEEINGITAPDGIPVDDAPEIPEEFIPEVKPRKPKRKVVKKAE